MNRNTCQRMNNAFHLGPPASPNQATCHAWSSCTGPLRFWLQRQSLPCRWGCFGLKNQTWLTCWTFHEFLWDVRICQVYEGWQTFRHDVQTASSARGPNIGPTHFRHCPWWVFPVALAAVMKKLVTERSCKAQQLCVQQVVRTPLLTWLLRKPSQLISWRLPFSSQMALAEWFVLLEGLWA